MRIVVAVLLSVALALGGIGVAEAKSSKSGSRPYYGGGKHSESHGGTYSGGQGSSHKGGSYKNPSLGNQYGKHK